MSKIIHAKPENLKQQRGGNHPDYVNFQRTLVRKGEGSERCKATIYEIPPMKSAYPYHYHIANEEIFYIISGQGTLKTPDGDVAVSAGELLFFPANENGAHKLTNTSETEPLIYLDVDTQNDIDVCFYPDSNKIGVWGKTSQVYRTDDQVDYYEGE